MQGQSQIADGVSEGDVIAGKYRLERLIGEGGMGKVVVARHLELDELVAIKFLLPDALANSEAVMRFAREARASVKIRSEHVARTLDVGKLDNGTPYMVMEYLEGADLGARLRAAGPLPIEQAVDFTLQACQALADAHAIGIIHRDIKPSNLFVIRKTDGTESVKVLDFGISKVTGAVAGGSDMGMTRTQTLMGSPLYMSPEQMASSKNVSASSDIWALGVTLFELLTGVTPFTGESITELCSKVLTQRTPPVREWRPELPNELQAVVARCLEKEPAQRYPNVAELAVALMPFGSKRGRHAAECAVRVLQSAGMSLSALALPPSSGLAANKVNAQATTGTVAPWSQTHPGVKRRNSLLVATVAVVVFFGVAAAAVVRWMGSKHSEPASSAAAALQSVVTTASALPSREPVVAAAPSVSEAPPSALAPSAIQVPPIALAPSASQLQPMAAAPASQSTSGARKMPVLGRNDKPQKPRDAKAAAAPVASSKPKGTENTHSAPGASGVSDFGGRLY